VWYPTRSAGDAKPAKLLPNRWRDLASRRFIPGDVEGWAIDDAPVSSGLHPLLFMLPGMGGLPTDYTTVAEDLASFGYIVVGVTPTGSARVVVFPDGRVAKQTDAVDLEDRDAAETIVERWQDDVRYVWDQLRSDGVFDSAADFNRAGIFGHSFGGAVSLHFLADDARFRRGANLDGAPQGKPVVRLNRPVLFFNGADLPPSQHALNDRILAEMKTMCANDPAGCRWRDAPDAGHMNFADLGILPLPPAIPRSYFSLTKIDGLQFLRDAATALREFFDAM
jgi:dienelactone hydrolase